MLPNAITAVIWNAACAIATLHTLDKNANVQPTPILSNSNHSAKPITHPTYCAVIEATASVVNVNVNQELILQK